MAFCKMCGSPLNEGADFCPTCGAPTGAVVNVQPQQSSTNGTSDSDHTWEYDADDIEKNKAMCAIAYLYILFFLPLVASPDSRFGRFHANQALLLLIYGAVISAVCGVISAFGSIPYAGTVFSVISVVISSIGGLSHLAGSIFGFINALTGKAVDLPLIGKIKIIK